MTFINKHAAWLFAFLILGCPAEAQFRGMPEALPALPAMPAAPMAMPAPMTSPGLGTLAPAAPSVAAPNIDFPTAAPAIPAAPDTAAVAPAPAPAVVAPGCPGSPDCPADSEAEGPFSEAVKEMLKEFAKCEAEGKSLETCLSDDPPPPQLSQLPAEDRLQLTQCLGSSDLSATKERWRGCLVGAD